MKRYQIASTPDRTETLEIISEGASGFQVRIVRQRRDYTEREETFMTHELFETCLRTGYITEIPAEPEESHSVA